MFAFCRKPVGGGTSPSTQEAIAGMLSISQNWAATKAQRKKYEENTAEENVNNVHQDEDYGNLNLNVI